MAIVITDGGREAIKELLGNEFTHDPYSIAAQGLLAVLGRLALREDTIEIRGGRSKVKVDYHAPSISIDAEFYLTWVKHDGTAYMYGGLNWSDSMQKWSCNT